MKTMGKTMLSMLLASFLVVSYGHTQQECNIEVSIDNSNCNDNTLIGGGSGDCGCSCGAAPCGKKLKKCCDVVEVIFDGTFAIDNITEGSITITPFIQRPSCEFWFGMPGTLDSTTTSISLKQCAQVCFECDGCYQVGYLVNFSSDFEAFDFPEEIGFIVNDVICVCGQRVPGLQFNATTLEEVFELQTLSEQGFISTFVTIPCCDNVCDCDCCDQGCNRTCVPPSGDSLLRGIN